MKTLFINVFNRLGKGNKQNVSSAKSITPTLQALLAAAAFAISIPLAALLLNRTHPLMVAAWLYLGAGFGMSCWRLAHSNTGQKPSKPITRAELPYIAAMIGLDILAPILLMFGLATGTAENASLLSNFEIVATTIIALAVFKETVSKRLWLAIILITVASIFLSIEPGQKINFSLGSLLVIAATCCWGIENNCTRVLANHNSVEIVIIKGFGSGAGALIIAIANHAPWPTVGNIVLIACLGFISYGMSINLYVKAQKNLGAAKTSACYAINPLLGVAFSFLLIRQTPEPLFWPALLIMAVATYFLFTDSITIQHTHEHSHTLELEHSHGQLTHTHQITIVHSHMHTHTSDEDDHQHSHRLDSLEIPEHSH